MSSTNLDTRTKILTETWKLLEEQRGQNVHMSHIAKAVGISRQAVYLHFPSRTELIVETVRYVDEVKGLNDQLAQLATLTSATALLDATIEVWGNHIPEIYGLAKTMLQTRDTDEAMAAAWGSSMGCLRDACQAIIGALALEGRLIPHWSEEEATDMLSALLSFSNWEQLTVECSWEQTKYVEWMKVVAKQTFVTDYS